MAKKKIPAAPSIRRLPSYLHIIQQVLKDGNDYISGTVIANELNLEPIQVRKDLAITGIIGKPKRGYPIKELVAAIEHFLGWDSARNAVLLGAGNLGAALIGYDGFRDHGLNLIAAFDKNPEKIGQKIHGIEIFPFTDVSSKIKKTSTKLAILTVPSADAQETADLLIKAGINAIWNFTNVKLKVPDHVVVQKEDLSSGYAMLCVMIQADALEKKDE
jgi:redox-sensing transcriptional repressor